MEDSKVFWLSKRFWGAVFAAAGMLLPLFGISDTLTVSNLGSSWMNLLAAGCQFGGLAISFYGGVVAKKPLALTR